MPTHALSNRAAHSNPSQERDRFGTAVYLAANGRSAHGTVWMLASDSYWFFGALGLLIAAAFEARGALRRQIDAKKSRANGLREIGAAVGLFGAIGNSSPSPKFLNGIMLVEAMDAVYVFREITG
jgi:hypothetical protein